MTARRTLAEQLARTCEDQGFRVKRTRSGYTAYAKDGVSTAGWHITPTDHRAYMNIRADLRKIGVAL